MTFPNRYLSKKVLTKLMRSNRIVGRYLVKSPVATFLFSFKAMCTNLVRSAFVRVKF